MREERVPPVRPRRKFDLLGFMARADVTGIGPIRLHRKTDLHPFKCRVVHVVLYPEVRKRAEDDLGDLCALLLIERNLCGSAGDKRQAAQLYKAHNVVFVLGRRLMGIFLEVPQ